MALRSDQYQTWQRALLRLPLLPNLRRRRPILRRLLRSRHGLRDPMGSRPSGGDDCSLTLFRIDFLPSADAVRAGAAGGGAPPPPVDSPLDSVTVWARILIEPWA